MNGLTLVFLALLITIVLCGGMVFETLAIYSTLRYSGHVTYAQRYTVRRSLLVFLVVCSVVVFARTLVRYGWTLPPGLAQNPGWQSVLMLTLVSWIIYFFALLGHLGLTLLFFLLNRFLKPTQTH